MPSGGDRYIDIRSRGGSVIGRVHEKKIDGQKIMTPITAPTRKHLLRIVRSTYRVDPSHHFKRRGVTHF